MRSVHLCIAVLFLGVTGCSRTVPSEVVSVGYIPIADAAPLYVAIQEGLFEANSVSIEAQSMRSGALIIEAVASGRLDAGFANVVSFMLAEHAGIDLVPLGGVVVNDSLHVEGAVLALESSQLASLAELPGRTVAVNSIGNIVDVGLRKALATVGVDATAVSIMEMPFPQMEAALRGGRVDAITAPEPFWTLAETQGGVRVIGHYILGGYPEIQIAAWFTRASESGNIPQQLNGFTTALSQAVALINEPSFEPRLRAIISQYTGVDTVTSTAMRLPRFEDAFRADHLTALNLDLVKFGLAQGVLEDPLNGLGR